MLFSWVLRSSIFYGLFLGLVSVIIFVFRLTGIPVTFGVVTLAALIPALFILRKVPTMAREKMTWARVILILLILFNFSLVGLEAVSSGIKSVDGFHIWGLKGHNLYRAIDKPFAEMAEATTATIGSDYPLLVPLSEVWVSLGLGRWDDLWVKILFPLFMMSFLLIFYCGLRQFMGDPAAIFFTFLLSTVSFLSRLSTHNGADVPLMYYYSSSVIFMVIWFKNRESFWLMMSGVFTALCMWTKFEGIPLAGLNLFVFALFCGLNRDVVIENRAAVVGFLTVITAGFLLVSGYRILLNKPYANNITLNKDTLINFFPNLVRLKEIGYRFQKELFGAPNKWNLVAYVFMATLVFNTRKCLRRPYVYLLMFIVLNFAMYAAIYIATNFGLLYHLESTWTRMFLHFMPLLLFFASIVLAPVKESTE